MASNYLEPVRIFHGASVAVDTVHEADEFGKLKARKHGLPGTVVAALIKCAFTAEETGTGGVTITELWRALSRITINTRRLGMFVNNIPAMQLAQDFMIFGYNYPYMSAVAAASSGAGDQTVDLYLPIVFATEFFGRSGPRNLAGGIAVSEFQENADFKVTIGTGALGSNWSIQSDVVNLDIYLFVAYSDRLPEPVKQEVLIREYSTSYAELPIDARKRTRIRSLWVSDDGDSDFDASGVTSGSLSVDEKTILNGIDGDTMRFMFSAFQGPDVDVMSGQVVTNFPEFMPLILPADRMADSIIADRRAWLEDVDAGESNYYVGMRVATRPTADVRRAILRDMAVPDSVIETARAEENDARSTAVSFVENVPARIINPREFAGQSEAEIVVYNE